MSATLEGLIWIFAVLWFFGCVLTVFGLIRWLIGGFGNERRDP